MKKLRKIFFLILVTVFGLKAIFIVIIFFSPKIDATAAGDIGANQLITLTNNYRAAFGEKALAPNPRLTQAALNRAKDMLSEQYFAHTSPEGKKFSAWVKDVNYQYFYVGENLAIDFSSGDELFKAWLDSPTHRENILRPEFQEIGIAIVSGRYYLHPTILVVQLFGTRIKNDDLTANWSNNNPLSTIDYPPTNANLFIIYKLNHLANLIILIIASLLIISYPPQPSNTPVKTTKPKTKRYQAKKLRE